MRKATEKQQRLIQDMEQMLNVKFQGQTVAEASQFISAHMAQYKEAQAYAFEMIHNIHHY